MPDCVTKLSTGISSVLALFITIFIYGWGFISYLIYFIFSSIPVKFSIIDGV